MRYPMLASVCLAACCLCNSCKKASPSSGSSGASSPSTSATPSKVGASVAPQWLSDAMRAGGDSDDPAVQQALAVPDHAMQIETFAREATGDQCFDLVWLVGSMANRTQDPRYLETAEVLSNRLRALGQEDSSVMILECYSPGLAGERLKAALLDDTVGPISQCGVINWLADWHERDPDSVAELVESCEQRVRSLFADSLTHDDRDHAILGARAVNMLRRCQRISREESLGMLDDWHAQFGDITGFQSMYDRIREYCESSDK